MKILSIETSCDETAISLIEASGDLESPTFSVIGNSLISQINIHNEYGGVFPMLAKREHAKNLVPILKDVLIQSKMFTEGEIKIEKDLWNEIEIILSKEEGLYKMMMDVFKNIESPKIDLIAVTNGPGLAPALWVGISFAKALQKIWNIPLISVNHMEGHICSVLLNRTDEFKILNLEFKNNSINFPALALLISGGHTELVEIKNWGDYKIIGETKDDAVGEAFDKVARMLGLPYPGGPEISKLAEYARESKLPATAKFPRPMIHSHDLNFSFSGLKTSVLYYLRDNFSVLDEKVQITKDNCADIAREFEDSVIDVLKAKTIEALEETNAKTLIIAGGVIANKKIREAFLDLEKTLNGLKLRIPNSSMATDNAIMIGMAGYMRLCLNPKIVEKTDRITAEGNLKLCH
ncbi:MAG: tRNA (adenosine(37)-N6)-threonylcarbamoyltransferase complex transferase subunit TsaD [Candidatus Zambryskibacteria bacterium]|nr:tRNA (adenosine(37)-N6)-threonylcarbamoyltransferase complex transferase subunit TsaD [Candidatus Zambryskibacteria bacterium]